MAKKVNICRFLPGQIVFSKAGHDHGKKYVILKVEDEQLLLADGVRKMIENPKWKNARHVQRTNYIAPDLETKLEKKEQLSNEDILKAIQLFEAKCKVIGG